AALLPVLNRTLSPRTGGWTAQRPIDQSPKAVVPPHGGMDRSPATGPRRMRGCPPARGDGPAGTGGGGGCPGLSPRTGGWTDGRSGVSRKWYVVPPHGGMDRRALRREPAPRRCPPARGDGPTIEWQYRQACKLSPRTG